MGHLYLSSLANKQQQLSVLLTNVQLVRGHTLKSNDTSSGGMCCVCTSAHSGAHMQHMWPPRRKRTRIEAGACTHIQIIRHKGTQVSMASIMQGVCLKLQSPSGLNAPSDSLLFLCLSHFCRTPFPPSSSLFLALLLCSLCLFPSCRLISLQSVIAVFTILSWLPPSLSPASFCSERRGGKEHCGGTSCFYMPHCTVTLPVSFLIHICVCLSAAMILY